MKQCTKCKQSKPSEEYSKCKTTKDGLQSWCRECNRKAGKKYYANNKHKWKKDTYSTNLKKLGCTEEEYLAAMSTSDSCQICGDKERLCYDHCHTTGKFRGVLCQKCNSAIGLLGDTADSLRS